MIQPVVKIEIYNKIVSGDSITYPSTADYIIDDFIDLNVSYGIKKRKDKISFRLQNHRELNDDGTFQYSNDNTFSIDTKDLVKVYAWNGVMTGSLSDHLILSTYVKSLDYNSTESEGFFSFTCFNRTEMLLNSFMFAPYNDAEKVPNMIVDSISKIRNFNQNDIINAYKDYTGTSSPGTKGAYDADGNAVSGKTGYIRAYKKDAYKTDSSGNLKDGTGGDPDYTSTVPSTLLFPDVPFVETYKPFIDHLEDLSTDKFTEDTTAGVYVSSIDNDNNLKWEPKLFSVSETLEEKEHTSVSMSKDNANVINAIIINAGTDPNHNGILTFAFNASSMGANGAKWKYVPKIDIAEEIRRKEKESGDYESDDKIITGSDNTNNFIGSDNYPDSYPWTIQTTGSDIFGDWEYTAHTTSVTNDDAYRNYFRRVSKRIGEKKGNSIVKYSGELLFKGKWELEFGNLIRQPNQMVTLNIPSLNFNKNLRIVNVNHTFNNGWNTTYDLEEDVDYNLSTGT